MADTTGVKHVPAEWLRLPKQTWLHCRWIWDWPVLALKHTHKTSTVLESLPMNTDSWESNPGILKAGGEAESLWRTDTAVGCTVSGAPCRASVPLERALLGTWHLGLLYTYCLGVGTRLKYESSTLQTLAKCSIIELESRPLNLRVPAFNLQSSCLSLHGIARLMGRVSRPRLIPVFMENEWGSGELNENCVVPAATPSRISQKLRKPYIKKWVSTSTKKCG